MKSISSQFEISRRREKLSGINYNELARFRRIAGLFQIRQRCLNLNCVTGYTIYHGGIIKKYLH